ncbi:hypothetical protein [Neorhizobium vignae]|uniref:hypothetical protein n=1 Tax=Neorhizobium vignae TaxID=690585 RepID=UPI000B2BF438|nr:hypothetical protein [Neorhizobium vignae]
MALSTKRQQIAPEVTAGGGLVEIFGATNVPAAEKFALTKSKILIQMKDNSMI